MRFPKGFLWGTATAAHQVEGNNVYNTHCIPRRGNKPRPAHWASRPIAWHLSSQRVQTAVWRRSSLPTAGQWRPSNPDRAIFRWV
jgi:hypothetical protein